MASGDPGRWSVGNIVYVAVISPVLAAAVLEWFLWLAGYTYCFIKVAQKADHWTTRLLAVIMTIVFWVVRSVFLPVMAVTLPLPSAITRHFPSALVAPLQWFAFWTFAALLNIPWLVCVYQSATNSIGRKKQIKEVLKERNAPKIVVVMPVYKEPPDVLVNAIDSLIDSDYPTSCVHIFLSFDGAQVDELYLTVTGHLGVPVTIKNYPTCIDATYRGARVTVSRFEHGGKRHCQKMTYKLIDRVYKLYLKKRDDLFMLLIDSDCCIDPNTLQNFMWDMELKPGSDRSMLAMTGVITSSTKKNSILTVLQDMEYIHGQLFERSVESGCGSVTCLPGALTMLRFSAFRKMAKYYFADKAEQCSDLFDYGKCHLGEDRWLTHLFMIGATKRYQIGMCTSAFCKTEAVQDFRSLLKQRRRWFLGFITNEACMLTDIRIWKRYPLLCIVRLMQNTIRTTALLFIIMLISVFTTSNRVQNLPVGFIAVSLGLNILLMFYLGVKIRRYKAFLYPLMFVVNPFFNWIYMVYGIFTAGQRTWGGPRADAAAADKNTTPEEAAVLAKAAGDELNVDLDTFPAVAKGKTTVPLHPSRRIEGQFVTRNQDPNGFYYTQNDTDSTITFPGALPRNSGVAALPLHHRGSFDSEWTNGTEAIPLPRTVESIMGEEDQRKLQLARQSKACSTFEVDLGDFDLACLEFSQQSSMSEGEERSRFRSRGDSPAGSTRSKRMPSSGAALPYKNWTHANIQSPDTTILEAPRGRAGRSPLGRNSPLGPPEEHRAKSPQAGEHVEAETESPRGTSENHHREEVEVNRKRKRRRSRLTKKSLDPGDMA
ncbi:hypothetical protein AJ79_01292 [Helicocarpus griseus UAMH5409]|uniref:chitin synthase n=1 Tax=Helicocarpus griseus UAMH5409 TaxID=1447875 RepID=A0A2B7XZC3_9EURO|nr:hypothetical protein AJ79_01292 [Helicocarpus griseus UAMH5409]